MIKRISITFYILLSLSTNSKAQSMTSRKLLNHLTPFWLHLEELRKDLQESTCIKYTSLVEQSYRFIQLELKDEEEQIFLEIKYQLDQKNKLSLYSFYCDDENSAAQIKIKANQMLGDFDWHTKPKTEFNLNPKQIIYLEIADRIASLGNDIDAYPSYYGSFILSSKLIKLAQINHMNSRSLNHKDSYFLRDLYFVLPLKEESTSKENSKIKRFYIGDMEIYLQDRSAKSRRETGDKIMAQLQKEMEKYKKENAR